MRYGHGDGETIGDHHASHLVDDICTEHQWYVYNSNSLWISFLSFTHTCTCTVSAAKSLSSTITLTANITLKGICPLTAPVEYMCNGTDIVSLTWKLNSLLIRTMVNTQPPSELVTTEHPGIRVQLVDVVDTGDDRANISTRLIVEPSTLTFGDQILCNNATTNATLIYSKKGIATNCNTTCYT